MDRNVATDAMEQVTAAWESLCAEDREAWSSAGRNARLRELLSFAERVQAEVIRCAAESRRRSDWKAAGFGSLRTWVAHHGSLTQAEAKHLMQSARLVEREPEVAKALAHHDVSASHVRTMAKVACRYPEQFSADVHVLVDAATTLPPEHFRSTAMRWRWYADQHTDGRDAWRQYESRYLHVSSTFDGMGAITGLVDPETKAYLVATLQSFDRPDAAGSPNPRTQGQRWADALGRMVRGERPNVTIDAVVDAGVLAGALLDPIDGRCEIAGVGPVSPTTMQRLACDARIAPVTNGEHGPVVGRRRASVPEKTRRAVVLRDDGCRVVGCDMPAASCDVHHVVPRCEGGTNDLTNLVLLCRHHHTGHHEGRFRYDLGPPDPRGESP